MIDSGVTLKHAMWYGVQYHLSMISPFYGIQVPDIFLLYIPNMFFEHDRHFVFCDEHDVQKF